MNRTAQEPASPMLLPASLRRWTETCGNEDCRTGWLQLWRSRAHPRFEGGWACSSACLEQIIARSVCAEVESWESIRTERALRMPLGLILLSRGWISHAELQNALAAQRRAQHGRIGEWLRDLCGISEETIAKALAIQWSCAVLPEGCAGLELARNLMPDFLQRRYELLPVRQGSDGAVFLAGRCRAERAAARALERMLACPVSVAFLEDRTWERSPSGQANESDLLPLETDGAVATIARCMERAQSRDARLVRMHDHLWLRMWVQQRNTTEQVRDIVLPLRSSSETADLLRAG
ncbi:MAG: hypothetical protein JWM54_290 [Acidobacteriaceae bacterium]|nr:hypothetical protein [Acidobacteriaceae bacterium]